MHRSRSTIPAVIAAASALVAVSAVLWAAQPTTARAAATGDVKPPEPKAVGYAIGFDAARSIAERLESDGVAFDKAALAKGFADALSGAQPDMTEGEIRRVLIDLEVAVGTFLAQERLRSDPLFAQAADDNAQRGTALQQSFARRQDVVKLPSGLMYEVAKEGTGDPVTDAKFITVTFTGATAAGVRYVEGQAARVEVASLLPAVREAAKSMRVGEKRVMIVPPELAFGLAGHDEIGPNETLIITAELLEVER